MRLKAKIYRVSEVAEIPIDGTDDRETVRKNVLETAAKFPGRILENRKQTKNYRTN